MTNRDYYGILNLFVLEKVGGVLMKYIGSELQDRMNLLGISVSALSEVTFMDEDLINGIISDRIVYEDIDEFDMSLICSALHCDDRYFTDDEVRNKDLLVSTKNRGKDSVKSKNVKAKIQDFMNDFAFVNEILLEETYDVKKRGNLLTRNIYEAVNKARAFFEIENYPGDFFSRLEKINYIDKYGVLLFKEDIDKLSGFIGYGINDIAVICVNYKRSYGHQNFTLAHEFGHLFLHKGVSISDDDRVLAYSNEKIEQEANEFASELLYPVKLLSQDYNCAVQQDLFNSKNRKKLGEYIDKLCHKYCLSYEMVLRKLLYKNRQAKKYKTIRKEIEKAIGGKVSEVFEKDFYTVNEELPQYQKLKKPYLDLNEKVNRLITTGKIGAATGEAIKLRNGVEND